VPPCCNQALRMRQLRTVAVTVRGGHMPLARLFVLFNAATAGRLEMNVTSFVGQLRSAAALGKRGAMRGGVFFFGES